MKKGLFFLVTVMVLHSVTHAQRYYGIANSNYAGINGLYINPAKISDNRLKADIQLFSVNGLLNQNYGFIPKFKDVTKSVFDGNDLTFTRNSRKDNIGFDVLIEGRGPSFMFQLNKKSAIGLLTRARVVGSGRGINTNLFTLLNDGVKDLKLANGTEFNSGKVNICINSFSETGIVYGRELMNKGQHFLKGGITVKKYNGIEFSSIRFKDFRVKLIDTSISRVEFQGGIEASKSFTKNGFDNIEPSNIFNGGKGSGVGFDLGFEYEMRDGDPISIARYENKYKFKLGLSIQDIGSMKYKSTSEQENFIINTNGPKVVNRVDTANLDFEDVTTYFKTIPGVTAGKNNNATKVKAPTTVTLYADVRLANHLYVNALFVGGLVGDKTAGTRMPFQAVVTPRFESKIFDFGLPIGYNALSKDVKVGVGLRLGFLFLGSDDILSNMIGKINGANAYAGLRVGFPYRKPKEKKEVEEVTPQPEIKKETLAPPAPPADTDADGIVDAEDKCPTVAGKKEFNGCPDTDGDGIEDAKDKCPTVAGVAAFEGCADTDGDGLQDSEDECPTEKGDIALKGCPDKDKDGVADKNDKCVDKPGPIDNDGCPRVTEKILKRLEFAAQAIQFETGKAIIKKTSYKQLDEVVKILNEYGDYQLVIDGHTDNTGKADKNQILSEARATAVKTYFEQKGITADRMIATGYGATKPLVPNTTTTAKVKNRRVELDLKLKD
jgi:outer membrane protein OmpA-like peptidoglycan-associated protein